MLNEFYSKLVLSLLIIGKGEPLNNSYKIIRILEWKFNTSDVSSLLEYVRNEKLVKFNVQKGVHHYELTSLGNIKR